ncbi:hypothetical protein R1flu_014048 [Riccia fluitans]|uniref:Uncharacterized protein n=1 Tax=Riccia fluitans TaxID=41844 RepID=A0ABD1YIQ7_9MARC
MKRNVHGRKIDSYSSFRGTCRNRKRRFLARCIVLSIHHRCLLDGYMRKMDSRLEIVALRKAAAVVGGWGRQAAFNERLSSSVSSSSLEKLSRQG